MPIEIECQGFAHPLSSLNGRQHLRCSKWKLFLAALTCGYDGFFKNFGADWHRRAIHISGSVTPFVETRSGGILALSNYYFDIDNSENKQAAYFIGQGLTKLFACQILNAPIVVHASRSSWMPSVGSALKAPLLTNGRKEADLFAFGSSGTHVLESKGRSVRHGVGRLGNSAMNAAMGDALGQVSAINTVNGIAPTSRSGCVWTLCTTGFRGDIQDPPGAGWDATVTTAKVLRSNYALFLAADQERLRSDLVPGYSLVELPGSDYSGVFVGILTDILKAVSSGQVGIEEIMSLASSQEDRISRIPSIEYLEDGTLIYGSGKSDFDKEEHIPPETVGLKKALLHEPKQEFGWETSSTVERERKLAKIYLTT